jgi:SAM-dependent methyltransferase
MNHSDPFAEFKKRQREMWASFTPAAMFTPPVAGQLVKFAGIAFGENVLDVGTGTGVLAITAARTGAQVTGLDLTPELLDQARENARIAGTPVRLRRLLASERISDRHLSRTRRNEMRSAEGRQEVVERDLVRNIGHREAQRNLSDGLGPKQIIRAESGVENIAGLHPVRIVIVVGNGGRGQRQQRRSERSIAVPHGTLNSRSHAVA